VLARTFDARVSATCIPGVSRQRSFQETSTWLRAKYLARMFTSKFVEIIRVCLRDGGASCARVTFSSAILQKLFGASLDILAHQRASFGKSLSTGFTVSTRRGSLPTFASGTKGKRLHRAYARKANTAFTCKHDRSIENTEGETKETPRRLGGVRQGDFRLCRVSWPE